MQTMGSIAQRRYLTPAALKSFDFLSALPSEAAFGSAMSSKTAAAMQYSTRVGLLSTAMAKRVEAMAVLGRDIFLSPMMLAEKKKYTAHVSTAKPAERAIS